MPSEVIQARTFAANPRGGLLGRPIIEIVQPSLTLNDGNQMPMFGLGTWNAQGKELKDAVKAAIEAGYRHIDTAANYKNESLVGEAISECIEEQIVKREDLFVTTKLWNNSHSRGSVARALAKSLRALNMNYVDLYLIHYPIGYQEGDALSPVDARGNVITSEVDYVETWQGMEDVKRLGLAKSIGVSNFNAEQISRILYSCTIVPAQNQVSYRRLRHWRSYRRVAVLSRRSKFIKLTRWPLICAPICAPDAFSTIGRVPSLSEPS